MPELLPTSDRPLPFRPGLRQTILEGQFVSPDHTPEDITQFLCQDRGALSAWFGDELQTGNMDPRQLRLVLRARIDRDIATIDRKLATQIDAILHHPRFQRLEGSWRGVAWLVSDLPPESNTIVRLVTMQIRELARDLERALEFDQSVFFKLIYESEFGHPGGHPFGLLVMDHEVAHQPLPRTVTGEAPVDDISVMRQVAAIAAAAFVPVVLSAAPRLFGVDSFAALALAQNITAVLDDAEHARWRSLATLTDARFLCLTLPRLRGRTRWNRNNNRLRHEEYAPTENDICWHVAGYAFARNVLRAQHIYRWPADIRGVVSGKIGGSFVSDTIDDPFRFGTTTISRAPTELSLTDQQAQAFAHAGFMPLNTIPFGGLTFTSTSSLQTAAWPHRYPARRELTPERANRRISAEIASILCACRFAHHIKMLGRDMIGRLPTASEIERELQDWLGRYTNTSSHSSGESRARYPLLSSRVEVTSREGKPGHYGCVIHLQPHYQLDDVSTTFRLVTNLSSAERGGSADRAGRPILETNQ